MNSETAAAIDQAFCGGPPSSEAWFARREIFTGLGIKYFNSLDAMRPPEKFRVLERELERCYCSGAFLACIFFAAAIVETLKTDVNSGAREELNNSLKYIEEEIKWLKATRNDLAHYGRAPDTHSLEDYVLARNDMEIQARQACAIVYHVARAYAGLDPDAALKGTRRQVTSSGISI